MTSTKQRLEQFAYTLAVIWRMNCSGEVYCTEISWKAIVIEEKEPEL